MSLVESELGGPTVFKDLRAVDFDYVPGELPHRDDSVRAMTRIFRGLATGGQREHALLWGPVGCGKTVLAKRFAIDLGKALARRGKTMEHVHINCRSRKTAGVAMLGVLRHFDAGYPERGFSVGEMLQDLKKHLERRDAHLMIILDEVDALLRSDGSDLIYDLTRFSSEQGPTWHGVSVVMISQEDVLPRLDAAALSTFKTSNVIPMQAYGSNALQAIVAQRVELALNPRTIDEDTVCLIADSAAAQGGSARLAIEILQKAGQMADDQGASEIGPEEVRAAKADSWNYITTSKLQQQPLHPLLTLVAVARRLSRDGGAYTTTGAVENTYKLICEEYEEKPRAHTQFWKYLNALKDSGFIISRLSGEGQSGTTQYISIPDAPAAVVEEKVTKLIADMAA